MEKGYEIRKGKKIKEKQVNEIIKGNMRSSRRKGAPKLAWDGVRSVSMEML